MGRKRSRSIEEYYPGDPVNFSLRQRVQTGSGAHTAFYPMGTRVFFLGVKWPGSEADHSPPSTAEHEEFVELYLHSGNTP